MSQRPPKGCGRATPRWSVAAQAIPPLPVGKSDEHTAYPGTLTLSYETLAKLWYEIGESVHRAGVEKFVIINSHGGNSSIIDIVARNLRVRFGMFVAIASWHRLGYPKGLFSDEELVHGIHAGEIETSLMLALKTETVRGKMPSAKPTTVAMEREFTHLRAGHPAGFGWMARDLHPSGAAGDASAGTLDKGEAALDRGERAFVALLEDVHRFDLARLKQGPLGEAF
jgi:creatinine amidohydrolase